MAAHTTPDAGVNPRTSTAPCGKALAFRAPAYGTVGNTVLRRTHVPVCKSGHSQNQRLMRRDRRGDWVRVCAQRIRRTSDSRSDSTMETSSIETIGMYTRVLPRSMRMSPGNRPNHDSRPVFASTPARIRPATTRPATLDVPALSPPALPRSRRMSPGNRPNHDSRPVFASTPARIRPAPRMIRSVPNGVRIQLSYKSTEARTYVAAAPTRRRGTRHPSRQQKRLPRPRVKALPFDVLRADQRRPAFRLAPGSAALRVAA